MSKINKNELEQVIWVKTISYAFIILICIIGIIFAPKKVFDKDTPVQLATSMAIIDETNYILYDYEVYSNEKRFDDGLIYDVEQVKLSFQERDEIVAVKIYGEIDKTEVREDYIFITSPDTPELNIEYYLVKDLQVADVNVPTRTFIILFEDISRLVNNIYLVLLTVVSLSILIPMSIKLTRYIMCLSEKYKINSNKE
jgi:hypothetical protein